MPIAIILPMDVLLVECHQRVQLTHAHGGRCCFVLGFINTIHLCIKNLTIRKLNNLHILTVNDRTQNLVNLALKSEWKAL